MNEILKEFDEIDLVYTAAIKEITTKLEILDETFTRQHAYVPIHHIQSRLKRPESLLEKAERYGIVEPIRNMDKVRAEILDIAGIRVVCNYREDVYIISELLLEHEDVSILKIKDYCKTPKESGYRSLHIVIEIPVFLVNSKMSVPVEIQFRSIAMDAWASLEHELKYKNKGELPLNIQEELKECAKTLASVDAQMEEIRQKIL